ncbi:MAG: TetR/AcrR family transcriptional regulator [Pseudomonadota bacterium]
MGKHQTGPILHRDDPDKEPLVGNVKATREDWLNVAMDVLISDGVEHVKVLDLGNRLGVSRSSFYWYFKSRQALLDALLRHWQDTNTAAIVAKAAAPAGTITEAVCNFFHCVIDDRIFSNALDFAVRDWARRSGKVRNLLDQSDQTRLDALAAMFRRFDYPPEEAMVRARVLYFMQLGYDIAELNEPTQDRLKLVPMYLYCFTGREPRPAEIAALEAYARSAMDGRME